ncbi:MAG: transposase, partial [Hyphomicrobium aestuarii]|nr:transposase [Hyphomicrobium aestuarii]
AANKTPFVIAVQTRKGRPIYTQLRCITGFTKEAIKDYATRNIEPGSRVLSDGLGCFNGLADAGLKHVVKITGGGRPEGLSFALADGAQVSERLDQAASCDDVEMAFADDGL